MFSQSVKDVYFDYDKADLRGDQQASVQADAQFFAQHANMNFTIEGHCDERGSTEYNLALGDQRASAVKSALDRGWRQREPDQDDQLRQREAFLHGKQRSLLAAEPPWAFRLSEVVFRGRRCFVWRLPLLLICQNWRGMRRSWLTVAASDSW